MQTIIATCFMLGFIINADNSTVSDVPVQIYNNVCATPELACKHVTNRFGAFLCLHSKANTLYKVTIDNIEQYVWCDNNGKCK